MANTINSLIDFIKNHAWAMIVAIFLIGTNYGIMTSRADTLETQIDQVKETAKINAAAVQRIEISRSADITEIQTILTNILEQHRQYTQEIKELNQRFMELYQTENRTKNQ